MNLDSWLGPSARPFTIKATGKRDSQVAQSLQSQSFSQPVLKKAGLVKSTVTSKQTKGLEAVSSQPGAKRKYSEVSTDAPSKSPMTGTKDSSERRDSEDAPMRKKKKVHAAAPSPVPISAQEKVENMTTPASETPKSGKSVTFSATQSGISAPPATTSTKQPKQSASAWFEEVLKAVKQGGEAKLVSEIEGVKGEEMEVDTIDTPMKVVEGETKEETEAVGTPASASDDKQMNFVKRLRHSVTQVSTDELRIDVVTKTIAALEVIEAGSRHRSTILIMVRTNKQAINIAEAITIKVLAREKTKKGMGTLGRKIEYKHTGLFTDKQKEREMTQAVEGIKNGRVRYIICMDAYADRLIPVCDKICAVVHYHLPRQEKDGIATAHDMLTTRLNLIQKQIVWNNSGAAKGLSVLILTPYSSKTSVKETADFFREHGNKNVVAYLESILATGKLTDDDTANN